MQTEETDLKERAKRVLDRATRETGCKNVGKQKPELQKIFDTFPNDLEQLDDMIHDLKAKAEMCTGTDQSVGVVRACS